MRPWDESLKGSFASLPLIGTMALNSNLVRIFYERAVLEDMQITLAHIVSLLVEHSPFHQTFTF